MDWVLLTKYASAQNGWDCDFYGVLMWFENFVQCDLKLMFVTIPMYFSTIAKTIRCCDKLWFLGDSIVTRRDLQRSIVICLNLAILQELVVHSTNILTYGLSTNDRKKDGFLRLKVFTIVKIMSTDKEVRSVYAPLFGRQGKILCDCENNSQLTN